MVVEHQLPEEILMPQGARETACEECEWTYGTHAPTCRNHPDHDPTPWCSHCGPRSACDCGPIAENE